MKCISFPIHLLDHATVITGLFVCSLAFCDWFIFIFSFSLYLSIQMMDELGIQKLPINVDDGNYSNNNNNKTSSSHPSAAASPSPTSSSDRGAVFFGQLMGMCDYVTLHLAQLNYHSYKW